MPCTPATQIQRTFLLKEDGGHLLQENGAKVILTSTRQTTLSTAPVPTCNPRTTRTFEHAL